MKHYKRSQLFVDPIVQGTLLLRTFLYWSLSLAFVGLMMLMGRMVVGPSRDLHIHLEYLWFHYQWVVIGASALLPLTLADSVRVSNRIVGPMLRLQRAMCRAADGELDIQPLTFRKGDYWQELADQFNRMLAKMRQQTAATTDSGQPALEVSEEPPEFTATAAVERTTETAECHTRAMSATDG